MDANATEEPFSVNKELVMQVLLNISHYDTETQRRILREEYFLSENVIKELLALLNSTFAPGGAADDEVNTLDIVYFFTITVLCVAAILANVITLVGIGGVREQLSSHFILITSLCVADLLVGASRLLINLDLLEFCVYQIVNTFSGGMLLCSILNITAMAADHCIAILWPLRYESLFPRRRASICIILNWVASLLFGCGRITYALLYMAIDPETYPFCSIFAPSGAPELYVLYPLVTSAVIVMSIVYSKIYIQVHRSVSHPPGVSRTRSQIFSAKLHSILTTLLIVGTFFIGWVPLLIATALLDLGYADNVQLWHVNQHLIFAPVLNSLCDPIIYAIRLPRIREGLKNVCCSRRARRNTSGSWTRSSCRQSYI